MSSPIPSNDQGSPSSPKAQVGLALSWALQKLRANFTGFVALAAVVAVIQVAQQLAVQPINSILVDCLNPQSPGQINACSVAISNGAVSGVSLLVVFTILAFLATIGVYRAGIRATQGQPPSFAEMFTTENLGKYLLFTLAYIGLSLLGFIACIVPGSGQPKGNHRVLRRCSPPRISESICFLLSPISA